MLYKAPYHNLIFFTTTYNHFWTNLMFCVHIISAFWSLHNHSYIHLKSIYFMTSGDPSKYHQRLTSSLRSTYRLCIIASLSEYMTVCRLLNAHTSYSLSIKDLALLWKIFKDHFFQRSPSQTFGHIFIYYIYYKHIQYMLQKNFFFLNLTVKKVYSVIIQWHMFIFYFKLVCLPSISFH